MKLKVRKFFEDRGYQLVYLRTEMYQTKAWGDAVRRSSGVKRREFWRVMEDGLCAYEYQEETVGCRPWFSLSVGTGKVVAAGDSQKRFLWSCRVLLEAAEHDDRSQITFPTSALLSDAGFPKDAVLEGMVTHVVLGEDGWLYQVALADDSEKYVMVDASAVAEYEKGADNE